VSASRIFAVAIRIAQGFRRDERTLGLIFVVPIAIMLLLGWVLGEQKSEIVRVGVVNEAGLVGDRVVGALEAAAEDNGELAVSTLDSKDAATAAIRARDVDLAVVVPSTLATDIASGTRPTLTVISEGTDPAAEAGRFQKLQSVMADLASQLVLPGATPPIVPRVEVETVYLSPDATTVDVMAPVFLGYFGYFFVFLLTGISFLRERIGGTLERLLATPVTRAEIVLGYTLGFGIFATLQVILLTLFILNAVEIPAIGPLPAFTIGLGVDSVGSPLLTFAIALVLSLGAVSLGIFLSTFARTELQVIQFIPIVIVPQGVLGGIFWPIDQLPDVLAGIARILPMTYAVDGLREVMLKGADLSSAAVQLDLAVLGAIAVIFIALASATIKREVA